MDIRPSLVGGEPPDPPDVQLPTHRVTGPALYPRCELGHGLAILAGTHVRPWELDEHYPPAQEPTPHRS